MFSLDKIIFYRLQKIHSLHDFAGSHYIFFRSALPDPFAKMEILLKQINTTPLHSLSALRFRYLSFGINLEYSFWSNLHLALFRRPSEHILNRMLEIEEWVKIV